MPDERDQPSPEILLQIQTAEHEVEAMLRAAERDAAATIERARAQADALVSEKRRTLEEKKKGALAQGLKEAEREAQQLIENAQAKAGDLKARCLGRMDDAAERVLRRVLPAFQRTED
ncbi:MAG: hypothetical protein EWM72_00665 [Nitrospira sp.]|nr:MAG: hypothetical protein EWM72_00665 [Nitrospira sp.]